MENFTVFISSDPQYPWYDDCYPDELGDEWNENSERQITQQYQFMNLLAKKYEQYKLFSVKGHIINGDLTAYGHRWQLNKYKKLVKLLKIPYYPGLGNHDYENNVKDNTVTDGYSVNGIAPSNMINYMYDWLKDAMKNRQ
ncbi:MAG: metallophosphoesterase, partial [Tannerella sp.]|nr:metallophosphoesterase [Tannerella sp.]